MKLKYLGGGKKDLGMMIKESWESYIWAVNGSGRHRMILSK